MALNGVRRKRLSKREGAKNSNLPGVIKPLDRGPVDTKMTGIHGSQEQGEAGVRTNFKNFPGTGNPDCTLKGVPQAQGVDPNIGTHTVSDVRSHIKGHGGSGPNKGYGKAMTKY